MSDTKSSMHCSHCGKLTIFEVRGEGNKDGAKIDYNYHDGQDITTWRILECQLCKNPTIVEVKTSYELIFDAAYGSMEPISFEIAILYPEMRPHLTNLPEPIEKNYKAALRVQDIEPSACAVMIGRTLEAICNYENAPGKTLSEKLNNLVNSERIPKTLAQMAHQLRQIRNLGAHDVGDEPTEKDVPIIMDFIEAILEYLYVAPAKIAALQARLKKTP